MSVAADHAPHMVADRDLLAFDNAAIGARQLVDAMAEAAEARAIILEQVLREACRPIEAQTLGGRFQSGVGHQVAAHEEFRARDPKFDVELAHQPAGEADMVGMHVSDDHALDLAAAHRTGEELLPGLRRLLVANAAVDDGPTVAVLQQPQIDVVELHRQAHAHPVHAGCHDDALARFGTFDKGIVEIAARADSGFGCAHRAPFGDSGCFDYDWAARRVKPREFTPLQPACARQTRYRWASDNSGGTMRGLALFATAMLALTAAQAAQVSTDPRQAPAGAYQIEARHTVVLFAIPHLGLTDYYGRFEKASGTLNFAPGSPEKSSVSVTVDTG